MDMQSLYVMVTLYGSVDGQIWCSVSSGVAVAPGDKKLLILCSDPERFWFYDIETGQRSMNSGKVDSLIQFNDGVSIQSPVIYTS